MMKNKRKRLVGLTAIAASVLVLLSTATTALAAGREYSDPVQGGSAQTNTAGKTGSCYDGRNATPEIKGDLNSFSMENIKEFINNYCKNDLFNVPKSPSGGQTPAPASSPAAAPASAQTPAPTSSPTAAPSPSGVPSTAPDDLSAMEAQMVQLVNSERSKAGVPALTVDAGLSNMARVKSQDMITNGYFSHNSPTYGSPFDMMKTFGISFQTAGENIAMNQSVGNAHTSLMNSEGHRANILNPAFTQIGIGMVNDGEGNIYITQEFIG